MAFTYKRIGSDVEAGSGSGSATYYEQLFSAVSWAGPVSGYYFITIPQSTHNKSTNITVTVFENVAGDYEEVETFIQINSSLDVTIRIDATTDTRFSGKVLIL